ncbi:MAG: hypothetical protein HRU20_22000 [Pseudomonadales bacterium]|nr:hypothetical protein [Pseudomonadales bacterium]
MFIRPSKSATLAGLISSAFIPLTAYAAETDVNFSGFATVAYGKTVSDYEEGNFRDFNKFGLRLDADLQDDLTLTAQMTANGDDDYELDIDWLFATYYFTPSLALSVGKVRAPLFMYSDFLDVGYAYQ